MERKFIRLPDPSWDAEKIQRWDAVTMAIGCALRQTHKDAPAKWIIAKIGEFVVTKTKVVLDAIETREATLQFIAGARRCANEVERESALLESRPADCDPGMN